MEATTMTGNKREDLRINVNEDQECRNWAEKFGVTADELKRAVYKYGVLADDVARALGKHNS
jgi:hypothetical protein